MKKILLNIALSFLLIFCIAECKKDDEPTNIVLYNKPLSTIQHYIQGKWKFVYGKGGICGSCLHYCDNCFIEFTSDNKFISNTYAITSDTTTIHWVRDIGTWTNNDFHFLMTVSDHQFFSLVYFIERICNDTLIYHDNSSDAIFYHFIKVKY